MTPSLSQPQCFIINATLNNYRLALRTHPLVPKSSGRQRADKTLLPKETARPTASPLSRHTPSTPMKNRLMYCMKESLSVHAGHLSSCSRHAFSCRKNPSLQIRHLHQSRRHCTFRQWSCCVACVIRQVHSSRCVGAAQNVALNAQVLSDSSHTLMSCSVVDSLPKSDPISKYPLAPPQARAVCAVGSVF